MENFLGKVIKIVSGDKGVSKDYWIDDSKCKACYECESAFSQWNRRHHCRICGRVFCANCTRNSIPPPRESADQQWLRVCNYCYRVRQRSDQPTPRTHHQRNNSWNGPNAGLDRTGSIRQLLEPETAPALSGGTASSGSGSDLPAARGSLARTRSGRWGRGQSSAHRVASGDLSWVVPPPLEEDFGMSLADRDARLLHQQQLEAGAGAGEAGAQQAAHSLGEVHRQLFSAAADAHLRAVVSQLLRVEAVPQPDLWAPIVSGAAQAVAAYLAPALMYASGQHDPRQALQIKKVADVGRPGDTCVVTGVVVRKGLLHRRMRSYIEYPKVLLLAGSLEYQRETNKLSSFDLMDHDKQYLANAVARLAVLKPDVVLVEGSVARMAQEDLMSRNISVAQKVRSKLLERLARCMGVRVAPTVEHLSPATAHLYLGDCKVFRVQAETVNVPQQGGQQQGGQGQAEDQTAARTGLAGAAGAGAAAAGPAASAPPAVEGGAGSSTASQPGGVLLPRPASVEALRSGGEADTTPTPTSTSTSSAAEAAAAAPPDPPSQPPQQAPPRSRLLLDNDRGSYTSLSAAMMMAHLGSGPNAAAAVAAVSAGAGAGAGGAAVMVRSA
ncbi:hypothetical protein Agub_g5039, partial [Astrephomene gubernaculifera]